MKALVFDLDGVLVDVSGSYRRAVKETFRYFAGRDIDDAGIEAYKGRGGLNNDWDLTHAALCEQGLSVAREKVVEAFQRIYLGDRFNGLIKNERWLVRDEVLAGLREGYDLAIVTGRPGPETRFTLTHFDVDRFFPVVITQDDLPEGRGKPDPLGIRTALAILGRTDGYYAGDTVDDMRAAAGAGLVPIGVVRGEDGRDAKEAGLLAAGAARIVRDVNRIREVLS